MNRILLENATKNKCGGCCRVYRCEYNDNWLKEGTDKSREARGRILKPIGTPSNEKTMDGMRVPSRVEVQK